MLCHLLDIQLLNFDELWEEYKGGRDVLRQPKLGVVVGSLDQQFSFVSDQAGVLKFGDHPRDTVVNEVVLDQSWPMLVSQGAQEVEILLN